MGVGRALPHDVRSAVVWVIRNSLQHLRVWENDHHMRTFLNPDLPGTRVGIERVRVVPVRITFSPQIMGGRACIRGMRLPVSVIVGQIAHGATVEEVLGDYPDLEREDVQQALAYKDKTLTR